jgi:hypothetical protein
MLLYYRLTSLNNLLSLDFFSDLTFTSFDHLPGTFEPTASLITPRLSPDSGAFYHVALQLLHLSTLTVLTFRQRFLPYFYNKLLISSFASQLNSYQQLADKQLLESWTKPTRERGLKSQPRILTTTWIRPRPLTRRQSPILLTSLKILTMRLGTFIYYFSTRSCYFINLSDTIATAVYTEHQPLQI